MSQENTVHHRGTEEIFAASAEAAPGILLHNASHLSGDFPVLLSLKRKYFHLRVSVSPW